MGTDYNLCKLLIYSHYLASKSSKKDKRKSKIDKEEIDEDALQKAKLSLAEEEEMSKPEPVS